MPLKIGKIEHSLELKILIKAYIEINLKEGILYWPSQVTDTKEGKDDPNKFSKLKFWTSVNMHPIQISFEPHYFGHMNIPGVIDSISLFAHDFFHSTHLSGLTRIKNKELCEHFLNCLNHLNRQVDPPQKKTAISGLNLYLALHETEISTDKNFLTISK
jgi:hypothetical protein